jgi:homoserine kinase
MPETQRLHAALRERGVATALSGAGPSLVCLVDAGAVDDTAALARSLMPDGWSILTPGWDTGGAVLVQDHG